MKLLRGFVSQVKESFVDGNAINNAVLLIDKPIGKTSHETIAGIKRSFGIKKIGHSGTLDKFASGLLIVCTGNATRLTTYFLKSEKRYHGTIRLGITTDTCDSDGEIIEQKSVPEITKEQLEDLTEKFTGSLSQVPPKYSALKINGKRASDLVRSGKDVQLKERSIFVHECILEKVSQSNEDISFDIYCSSGTYIRSIARDIGEHLGTGAYLAGLRRITVGHFNINDSITIHRLEELRTQDVVKGDFLIQPYKALSDFGLVVVGSDVRQKVLNGALFQRNEVLQLKQKEGKPFRIADEGKHLLALAEIDTEGWSIRYLNVFNYMH